MNDGYFAPQVPEIPNLEDSKGENIPEKLWERISQFQRNGGYNGIIKSLSKLKITAKE